MASGRRGSVILGVDETRLLCLRDKAPDIADRSAIAIDLRVVAKNNSRTWLVAMRPAELGQVLSLAVQSGQVTPTCGPKAS